MDYTDKEVAGLFAAWLSQKGYGELLQPGMTIDQAMASYAVMPDLWEKFKQETQLKAQCAAK